MAYVLPSRSHQHPHSSRRSSPGSSAHGSSRVNNTSTPSSSAASSSYRHHRGSQSFATRPVDASLDHSDARRSRSPVSKPLQVHVSPVASSSSSCYSSNSNSSGYSSSSASHTASNAAGRSMSTSVRMTRDDRRNAVPRTSTHSRFSLEDSGRTATAAAAATSSPLSRRRRTERKTRRSRRSTRGSFDGGSAYDDDRDEYGVESVERSRFSSDSGSCSSSSGSGSDSEWDGDSFDSPATSFESSAKDGSTRSAPVPQSLQNDLVSPRHDSLTQSPPSTTPWYSHPSSSTSFNLAPSASTSSMATPPTLRRASMEDASSRVARGLVFEPFEDSDDERAFVRAADFDFERDSDSDGVNGGDGSRTRAKGSRTRTRTRKTRMALGDLFFGRGESDEGDSDGLVARRGLDVDRFLRASPANAGIGGKDGLSGPSSAPTPATAFVISSSVVDMDVHVDAVKTPGRAVSFGMVKSHSTPAPMAHGRTGTERLSKLSKPKLVQTRSAPIVLEFQSDRGKTLSTSPAHDDHLEARVVDFEHEPTGERMASRVPMAPPLVRRSSSDSSSSSVSSRSSVLSSRTDEDEDEDEAAGLHERYDFFSRSSSTTTTTSVESSAGATRVASKCDFSSPSTSASKSEEGSVSAEGRGETLENHSGAATKERRRKRASSASRRPFAGCGSVRLVGVELVEGCSPLERAVVSRSEAELEGESVEFMLTASVSDSGGAAAAPRSPSKRGNAATSCTSPMSGEKRGLGSSLVGFLWRSRVSSQPVAISSSYSSSPAPQASSVSQATDSGILRFEKAVERRAPSHVVAAQAFSLPSATATKRASVGIEVGNDIPIDGDSSSPIVDEKELIVYNVTRHPVALAPESATKDPIPACLLPPPFQSLTLDVETQNTVRRKDSGLISRSLVRARARLLDFDGLELELEDDEGDRVDEDVHDIFAFRVESHEDESRTEDDWTTTAYDPSNPFSPSSASSASTSPRHGDSRLSNEDLDDTPHSSDQRPYINHPPAVRRPQPSSQVSSSPRPRSPSPTPWSRHPSSSSASSSSSSCSSSTIFACSKTASRRVCVPFPSHTRISALENSARLRLLAALEQAKLSVRSTATPGCGVPLSMFPPRTWTARRVVREEKILIDRERPIWNDERERERAHDADHRPNGVGQMLVRGMTFGVERSSRVGSALRNVCAIEI